MSSRRPRRFLSSTVFRRALLANLAGLVAILLAIWVLFAVHYWQETQNMRANIETVETELLDAYEEGGLERVRRNLTFDERAEWDPDWLFAIMEEDEFIVRLVDEADATIAGFDGIDPSGGWSQTYIDHEDFDRHPVVSFRFGLESDDAELVIGQFVPDRLLVLRELLIRGTWLLSLALLPIALVAGFLTSRSVFKRLSTISATAEQVSQGRFSARVPLTGNGDEFDRVGEAVNDMLAQIATLARNLEGVSVGAAHDLKTPVSNLAGRLQLIERDLNNPKATSEHVQVAQNHIQALLRTLDALFRLGEGEAGKRKAAFAPVDLSELVEDLGDSFRPVFEEADKTIDVRTTPSIEIVGDSDLLTQMISNLLENVIEHARDGAHAWIKLRKTGSSAYLQVGDDGPGLPTLEDDDVFERFFRLDASRSTAGNGLGLSLVRSIAELHDGQARLVASEPGAIFEVEIPLIFSN